MPKSDRQFTRERLQRIASAVENSLGAEIAARVSFLLPDQFLEKLRLLPPDTPPSKSAPQKSHGYKVKTGYVKLSPQELKTREEEAIRLIAENMKRKEK